MYWEKKICFRLTTRRIVGAIVIATIVANMVIVGVVFGSTSFPHVPTQTPSSNAQPSTTPSTALATVPGGMSTFTPTSLPSVTVTATNTPTEYPTLEMCVMNSNWPIYYAQQGDTLASIARATGSSVDELIQANCLVGINIQSGQLLYVPRLPVMISTPTLSATTTYIASVTPTTTPTITLTIAPVVGTVFQNPFGTFVLCSERSDNFYVSVAPINPHGIRSVTAFYMINDEPLSEIPLLPDRVTYYGSTLVSGKYTTIDTVNFYFIALDGFGNMTESRIYNASITPCPTMPIIE